jgi:hypothetical protein
MQVFGEPRSVKEAVFPLLRTGTDTWQELALYLTIKLLLPAAIGLPLPVNLIRAEPVSVKRPAVLNEYPFTVSVLII